MSTCQECGKKTIILLGNATLGKWVCEKCDMLVEKNKITKTKPKTNDRRRNTKGL